MNGAKPFLIFLAKFLGLFCLLFYGTEAIIGLSAPGWAYNEFVARHLNFIDPFRRFLLSATQKMVSALGYETFFRNAFTLSFVGGRGIRMVYSCLGYGLLSFWIAFVFANKGSWWRKAAWMAGGSAALVFINILRLGLVLLATNRGWPIPLGWDHHTWFNLAAYGLIFGMIYWFDRSGRTAAGREKNSRRFASATTLVMAAKGQSDGTNTNKAGLSANENKP